MDLLFYLPRSAIRTSNIYVPAPFNRSVHRQVDLKLFLTGIAGIVVNHRMAPSIAAAHIRSTKNPYQTAFLFKTKVIIVNITFPSRASRKQRSPERH